MNRGFNYAHLDIQEEPPNDGYDLPVIGLSDGNFNQLHISTICCLLVSCTCSVSVLIMSYIDNRNLKGFFHWRQIDRIVSYLALSNGSFNIVHSIDHLNVFATQDHVRPKFLCQGYAILMIQFLEAQILMVNLVAINMFVLIYFNKRLDFGRFDWKLLMWMIAVPTTTNVVAISTDTLGSNGAL